MTRLDSGSIKGRGAKALKGRGAESNPAVRFDAWQRERDALDPAPDDELPGTPKTVFTLRDARSIISRNASPDVPFSQSINPYQGCEHGCIYCYARPSHAYLGLSAGLDFETRLFGKRNAAELLRRELGKPGYKCELIALGANTDPYQPVEREQRITRGILEVLFEHRHPVGIVTKSSLVERDIDLLAEMSRHNLAQVFVSITTLDGDLARKLEPRAVTPQRRVETLRRLSAAGVRCGVLTAPVIPFVNDGHIETILECAAQAGAQAAGFVILRLPREVRPLFSDWLERHFPLRAAHVLARVDDLHAGAENKFEFGERMRGSGEYAKLLHRRFDIACRRLGLNSGERGGLETGLFRVAVSPARQGAQMSLF